MRDRDLLNEVFDYIQKNAEKYVEELRILVKKPSVTATGVGECGELVKEILGRKGFDSKLIKINVNAPIVFSESVGKTKKTLLFYSHYDVMPPEPLEEWIVEPFSAEIREDKIIGRGVADTKSSLLADILAAEAVRDVLGELPVGVKFVFEGEEEVDSASLIKLINREPETFRADGMLCEAGSIGENGRPVISAGLKGSLVMELRAKTAEVDQHSMWAPIIPNAPWRLVWAITSLKDENEDIKIEGFYQNVREPKHEDLEMLKTIDFDEKLQKEIFGINNYLKPQQGLGLIRSLIFEPTCTICGVNSGFAGEGFMTINPRDAVAKIDFRLVPDQTCGEILEKLKNYLKKNGFHDIKCEALSMSEPVKTDTKDRIVGTVKEAALNVFHKEPSVWPMMPWSISTISYLSIPSTSGPCIMNPDSKVHAPNENIKISDFINGIKHAAAIIMNF
jgi:acetylornithine deacetylase/succinyl-diaminopimelate desuccinylase-like protein